MAADGYFYSEQAEMFRFFKVPYALVTEECFRQLSIDAKFLYGLFLDRMGLSRENKWFDEKGRVYIYFKVEQIMETMGVSRSKAINLLKELQKFGLVEKKRQGLNKPNLLYIKDFTVFIAATSGSVKKETSEEIISEDADVSEEEITPISASKIEKTDNITTGSIENDISGSIENDISGSIENDTSGSVENESLEVSEMTPNHIEVSQTELSYTESNHILSADAIDTTRMSVGEVRLLVQQNLEMASLISKYPADKEFIDGIENLITETVTNNGTKIYVAKKLQDAELVRARLLSLNASHIEYVMECLQKRATNVRNVKQYLLAMLFNAPVTFQAANKIKDGQKDVSKVVKSPANRFINYTQSDHDFDELERWDREQRQKDVANFRDKEGSYAAS